MNINAEKVKNLRSEKNMTQQVLAEACGLSLRTIQRVERYGNASNETAMALCSVLEIEQSEIVIPEVPVTEFEVPESVPKSVAGQIIQFAATLITGMVIGAALMMFSR